MLVMTLNSTEAFESTPVSCADRDPVASANPSSAVSQLCAPTPADWNTPTVESQSSSVRITRSALSAADRPDARLPLQCPPLLDLGRESRKIESRPREAGVARSVFDE